MWARQACCVDADKGLHGQAGAGHPSQRHSLWMGGPEGCWATRQSSSLLSPSTHKPSLPTQRSEHRLTSMMPHCCNAGRLFCQNVGM